LSTLTDIRDALDAEALANGNYVGLDSGVRPSMVAKLWATIAGGLINSGAFTVIIGTPSPGDVVTWSGTQWEPQAPSGGGSGTPAVSVTSETTLNVSAAVGVSTNYARQDHTHGTPSAATIAGDVASYFDAAGSAAAAYSDAVADAATAAATAYGNAVLAASTFGTDERLLRSDGTGRGAQASVWGLDDNGVLRSTTATAQVHVAHTSSQAPAFTTRSAGTRYLLWDGLSGSTVDSAIGIEPFGFWLSVPDTGSGFRFYAGVLPVASISGAGVVAAQSFSAGVGTGVAPFVVASTTLVTSLNADLLDGYHAAGVIAAGAAAALAAVTLSALNDVDITGLTVGDVLLWDGTDWVAGSAGALTIDLDDLGDVNAPAPNDGDVLTWDAGAGEWVSAAAGGGAGGAPSGYGLWADRATEVPSPATGSQYDASDTELRSVYSGGAWRNVWPGHGAVEVPAGLTAATGIVTAAGGGYTLAPAASTAAALEVAVSGASSADYIIGIESTAISEGYWPFFEIAICRSASGRAITFGCQGNNAEGQWMFASVTTRSGAGLYAYSGGLWGPRVINRDLPRFVWVHDDGTNLLFYFSWGTAEAGPWIRAFTTTRAAWLGGAPDFVGVACYSGATYLNKARLLHWTYTP
jgi:hypothetical protein